MTDIGNKEGDNGSTPPINPSSYTNLSFYIYPNDYMSINASMTIITPIGQER